MSPALFQLWLAVAMIDVQRAWWWHLHGALWGTPVNAQRGGAFRSFADEQSNRTVLFTVDMVKDLPTQWWGSSRRPTKYATEHWPTLFPGE